MMSRNTFKSDSAAGSLRTKREPWEGLPRLVRDTCTLNMECLNSRGWTSTSPDTGMYEYTHSNPDEHPISQGQTNPPPQETSPWTHTIIIILAHYICTASKTDAATKDSGDTYE